VFDKTCEKFVSQHFIFSSTIIIFDFARPSVVQQIEADAPTAAEVEKRSVKLAFETIFRHASRLLLDVAVPEQAFLADFFDSREQLLRHALFLRVRDAVDHNHHAAQE
jgi:hypothetical protein